MNKDEAGEGAIGFLIALFLTGVFVIIAMNLWSAVVLVKTSIPSSYGVAAFP